MRVILVLWFFPILLFGGWYGLSLNDVNFGLFFLEREFHDLIFILYGKMLGVPAEDVPALIAGVFVVDSLIILALAALRWNKVWLPQTVAWIKGITVRSNAENLPRSEEGVSLPLQGGPVPTAE